MHLVYLNTKIEKALKEFGNDSHKLTSLECTYKISIVAKKVLADGSQAPKYLPMTVVS